MGFEALQSQTGFEPSSSSRVSQDKSLKLSGSACVAADSEGFQLSAVLLWAD